MGEAVDVVWDASEDGVFIFKKTTSIMPPWADCRGNAEAAVNDICADAFTHDLWDERYGSDDRFWEFLVEVHAPAEIAGLFDVRLERKITASATMRPK